MQHFTMQRTCHLVVIVVVVAAVVTVVHILNLLANLLSFRDTHDDKDGSGSGGVRTRVVVQFLSNLLFVGIKSNTKQRHGEKERERERIKEQIICGREDSIEFVWRLD